MESGHVDDDDEVTFEGEPGPGFWLSSPAAVRKCKDGLGGGPGCHGTVNYFDCNNFHEGISLVNCNYVGGPELQEEFGLQERNIAVIAAVGSPSLKNIERLVTVAENWLRFNPRRSSLQVITCDQTIVADIPVSEEVLLQSARLGSLRVAAGE
jgi:hypothetical protein